MGSIFYGQIWQQHITLHVDEQHQICYIKSNENVANVPQLRSIERFWYRCAKMDAKQKALELDVKIKQKFRQFKSDHFWTLMARVATKVLIMDLTLLFHTRLYITPKNPNYLIFFVGTSLNEISTDN